MKNIKTFTAFVVLTLAALILGACAPTATATPTQPPLQPTQDLNAFATQVAAQVISQITQTAAAYIPPATSTPEVSPTPEISPTPTLAATATTDPLGCDKSQFVADISIPDMTQMTPNQDFVKTWQIKNTGTCTWTTDYSFSFGYGEKMEGQAVRLSKEVKPGESIDISVNLSAPATAGTYSGFWKLTNASGYPFGEFFYVLISVK